MLGFRRDAQGVACLGGVRVLDLLRSARVDTPAYVYDLDSVALEARELASSFGTAPHLIAYAVKANTAGTIVRTLAREGTGADVVSGAELEVALGAGIRPDQIVMSGVAKSNAELDLAIASGILAIQIESVEEVARVAARAQGQRRSVQISLRLNPGVEIDAHAHVATGHDEAKFGIHRADVARAFEAVDANREALVAVGISTHVGSMLAEPEPYLASARYVCAVAKARQAARGGLRYVDFGGGFGIDYGQKPVIPPRDFGQKALELLKSEGLAGLMLVVEPGRSLVGAHGYLVASSVQSKVSGAQRWLMIDAGMNDLIRPALYGAKHRIEPVEWAPTAPEWRVVGPVCESSDDFGAHPLGPSPPEAVVIRDAGAYGFVMASEYNGRALPAEVFVRGGEVLSVSRSPGSAAWVKRRLEA